MLRRRAGASSTSRSCCGRSRPTSARTPAPSRTGAGATSLWRVLDGMPTRHSSRSRSIMNARIRWRIEPKYWSSSSWPLGDGAPNSVRPVSSRSGRCSASRRSTRKYSCSGPMVVNTRDARRVAEPAQDAQRLLAQRLLRAEQRDLVVERLARERDVGRRDRQRDAVGLDLEEDRRGHVPRGVAAGLERGPDAARRERRRVGLALDEVLARELGDRRARRAIGFRNESCFSAVEPVIGTNQWVKWVAPWDIAHSFTPCATASAITGSKGSSPSIVRRSRRKIGLARYCRWAVSWKTYSP